MNGSSKKLQDVKRMEIQKSLGSLPPAVMVSLDSGILILARTPWRKPRIRRIYDRIGFVGLGPIPAHFSQIHALLAEHAHGVGDLLLGPEDVWCEDLADEASHILTSFFHNDSREEVRYVFAELMLAEISLEERDFDYLAYVTYDGRIVEASEQRGVIVVSGTAWLEDEDDAGDTTQQKLAKKVLDTFTDIWEQDADPRTFITKYRELVPSGGMLEIGWLDRGMVWEGEFGRVFNVFREMLPERLPTTKRPETQS